METLERHNARLASAVVKILFPEEPEVDLLENAPEVTFADLRFHKSGLEEEDEKIAEEEDETRVPEIASRSQRKRLRRRKLKAPGTTQTSGDRVLGPLMEGQITLKSSKADIADAAAGTNLSKSRRRKLAKRYYEASRDFTAEQVNGELIIDRRGS